jgi:hypothetical protein
MPIQLASGVSYCLSQPSTFISRCFRATTTSSKSPTHSSQTRRQPGPQIMNPFTNNHDPNTAVENLQSLEGVFADLAPQPTNTAPDKGEPVSSTAETTSLPEPRQGPAGEAKASSEGDLVGSKCEIMTFYNHSTHPSERRARWSEFQDPVAEERRLKELGKTSAVIHRQSKVEKDDLVTWVTTSIEAQSPRLRTVLDTVFGDYPSWYPDGSPYAVGPPFQPYVHRWETFLEVGRQRNLDEKTAQELQLLRRELEPRIEEHLSALDRVRKTSTISFENLWLILNPGCLMISGKAGPTQVFKLVQASFIPATTTDPARYELTLAYVEWNGTYCGIGAASEPIIDYKDSISVAKLPVYPIEFAAKWKDTEQRLIARGRKFESLRGYHIKTCKGKKYTLEIHPIRGCLVEVEKPVCVPVSSFLFCITITHLRAADMESFQGFRPRHC